MRRYECEFEAETLAAVLQSRWPERVESQLRAHVAGCEICSDVAAIAGAMDDARQETLSQAVVPASGRIWWLAQMRARREAAKAAGRPITAAQILAFACAVGLLGACFGATSTWFQAALRGIVSSVTALQVQTLLPSATALVAEHGALFFAVAVVLLLLPAGVYFAVLRD